MNINYTMFDTGLTGGARVLLEIANKLVDRGHHVTITSLGNKNRHGWFNLKAEARYTGTSQINRIVDYGLRKVGKASSNGYSLTYPHDKIRELINITPECDINVATYCYTAFSVFESGKGTPFYHMQHYEPLFFSDAYLKKVAEETYYLPLNKMVNSVWLKNLMHEKFGFDLPIVNPAIDHSIFYPREVKRNSDESRVMCFAKQVRWKGFPEALEAMRLIMQKKDNVKLIAFGLEKPSYETNVPYDFIKAPSDDQLATLYSSADVIICPSWYESFPLYPLEAMACGTPVITTPYGTEDYAFHEKNCLVVPPKDPHSLAEAALRLLESEQLKEEFRKEGPKTAKQFTWEKTVDVVERLFSQALASK
ncbi:MAG: glycosyltransferase family 4 protein [Candidatus Bathyarchaeota archaeon]|nr:glycosyltransferase family 4 protein [Candidatus Bathyarchaeota archaeon]